MTYTNESKMLDGSHIEFASKFLIKKVNVCLSAKFE